MKTILLLLVLALATGCTNPGPWARRVMAPNGAPAVALVCSDLANCYDRAQYVCHNRPYKRVDDQSDFSYSTTGNRYVRNTRSYRRQEWVVVCITDY